MPMKNMKLSPKQAKELVSPSASEGPEYPYGLRVCLDNEALKKLGIAALPDLGTALQLVARVEVCSINASESQDGGEYRSMDLQITDMALGPEQRVADPLGDLYPTMKAKA